jgi:hypothetical protein
MQRPTDDMANQFVLQAWGLAENPPDTNMVIDTTIAAITIGYPPAGVALGMAKELLGVVGVFDSPDPTGGVLGKLNGRIDKLNEQVASLRSDLGKLRGEVAQLDDDDKMRDLYERGRAAAGYGYELSNGDETPAGTSVTALKLRDLANSFLPRDRATAGQWLWSDIHVYTTQNDSGQPLLDTRGHVILNTELRALDYKPFPAFEYYSSVLMLWMVAIERSTGGNVALINSSFGADLERHARFLSVRPLDWHRQATEPSTLPEALLTRLSCSTFATTMHPSQGKCSYVLKCNDLMAQRIAVAYGSGTFASSDPNPNAYCTTPSSLDAHPAGPEEQQVLRITPLYGTDALARADDFMNSTLLGERDMERKLARDYGLETMTRLADLLIRLKTTGSVRAPAQTISGTRRC